MKKINLTLLFFSLAISSFATTVPASTSSTVDCQQEAVDPGAPADVIDDCSQTISPILLGSADTPDPISCEGTRVWTYAYIDCNNQTLYWTHTYIIDNSFSIAPPENTTSTVTCLADAVDPGAPEDILDACGQTVSAVLTGSMDSPDLLVCEGIRVWTYSYTDCSGNTAIWTHTYYISLNTSPIIPPDGTQTIECVAQAIIPQSPVVLDACGNSLVAIITENSDPICEGAKVYTYTYTDCSGLQSVYTYTYIIDLSPANVPQNTTSVINNLSLATQPTAPMVFDNCGNNIIPVISASNDPACEGEKVFTFEYIDCAGNGSIYTHTYIINYSTTTVTNPIDNSVSLNGITLNANASGYEYQWVDCANNFEPIPLEQNQSFTPTLNGVYAVKIMSPTCTVTSSQTTISSVGLDFLTENESFSIYPNPSSGKIIIELGEATQKIQIYIYSINGRLINRKDFHNMDSIETEIDGPKGIYFIEIQVDDKKLLREKIYKI